MFNKSVQCDSCSGNFVLVQGKCVIPNISFDDIKQAYGIKTEFKGPLPASGNLVDIQGDAVADPSEFKDSLKFADFDSYSQVSSSDNGFSNYDSADFVENQFSSTYYSSSEYSSSEYSSKFDLFSAVPSNVFRSNSRSKRSLPTIPETFDLRENRFCGEVIKNVYNQGDCANCWAHVSAAVITDVVCLQSRGLSSMVVT